MDKIFEKVKKNILQNELIKENDKIVLGVSGGPDSVFLLHVLNKIKEEKLITFDIIIAHINHGIREEAIHDQKFVETLAEKLGYKCYSLEVNVSKIAEEQKISEEECGSYNWAVELKDTHEIIGNIEVIALSKRNNNCEIGYVYGSKFWGKDFCRCV